MTIPRALFERFDILLIGKKVRFVLFFAVVKINASIPYHEKRISIFYLVSGHFMGDLRIDKLRTKLR